MGILEESLGDFDIRRRSLAARGAVVRGGVGGRMGSVRVGGNRPGVAERVPVIFGIGTRPHLIKDLQEVVEDGSNDWHHIGLDDSRPHTLGTPYANVDDTLESEIPFPHLHHIIAPALLEHAHESFDAAIDGEDITNASRRGGEIGEMIQRIDERQSRSAIEGPAVVEGGGDAHGGFVHIGDAEVDLPHGEKGSNRE